MLKTILIQKVGGTLTRAALAAAGGWLLQNGVATEADIQTLQGAGVVVVSIGLSLWEKRDRMLGA